MQKQIYDEMNDKITVTIQEASMPKGIHKWINQYAEDYGETIAGILGEIFWVFREYKATELKS
jgi:hypothetical protein